MNFSKEWVTIRLKAKEVDEMLYNGNNPILRVVGVEQIGWSGGSFKVAPREYSALTFRIKGCATITGGGKEYNINTNEILYLPQNMGYTADYNQTEGITIHFVTQQSDREIEVYSLQNVEQVYKLFLQARSVWENKVPGFEVFVMAQLYTILGILLENDTKTHLPQHFLNAVSFINSNFKNSELSIGAVCTNAGIGATVFRQLFSRYYGKTPIEYITDLRLETARNLISNGVSIENAAYDSGFNDSKYFARVVKKRFGCTPRDFKTYGK